MGTINDKRRTLVARFGHAHYVMTLHYLKMCRHVDPQLEVSDLFDSLQENEYRESPACLSGVSQPPRPCVNCRMAVLRPTAPQDVHGSHLQAYGLLRDWQDLDRSGALTAHLAALDQSLML